MDPKEVEALYESRVEPERRANLAEFFDTYPQRYDAHVAQLGYYLRIAKDLRYPAATILVGAGVEKVQAVPLGARPESRPVELPF